MPQARTIDEVIHELDEIIAWSRREKSRLGYFPSLYRKVTVQVKEGIANNFFDDGKRMEQLDVHFANRYLDAFDSYRAGKPVTKSWGVAFNASNDRWAIVLQHLLLGINAHINLDLGIAAARTAPGTSIENLKNDFEKINTILASLVNNVQTALSEVWPMLRLLDWIAGKNDEEVIHFSINVAREAAWGVATQLAYSNDTETTQKIAAVDGSIARLAQAIQHPGPIVGSITNFVRLGERGTIPEIISLLQEI